MEQIEDIKRLFFGLEVASTWPEKLPEGRLINESERHLTLAFLGKESVSKVLSLIPSMPLPPFTVGPVGLFDECLFFPKHRPRCVVWHIHFLQQHAAFIAYQKELSHWLQNEQIMKEEKRWFCPHLTLCRFPFVAKEWQRAFSPLPVRSKAIHLYESLGSSTYRSLWKTPFVDAFVEIEHTADMAFLVRGHTVQELYTNAVVALAFTFPQLLNYFSSETPIGTLEETVSELNRLIGLADSEIGCPFKAVSFHGELKKWPQTILEWEMIVDV